MLVSMARKAPGAFRKAVEDRLRQRASQSGQLLDRLLRVFVMGRFAARMLERYPDEVLIKGGYALEVRLHREQLQARTTKDLDVSFRVPAESALRILQEVGLIDLGDFLSYQVSQSKELILEGNEYGGTRYTVDCSWAGRRYHSFGLDVAFGEPQFCPDQFAPALLGEWLNSEGVKLPPYRLISREQHLAEKLHAYTIPRPTTNSRVRDFPDMGLLLQGELMGKDLYQTIQKVFGHRGTHEAPHYLPEPPQDWAALYLKLRKTEPALFWDSLAQLQQLLAIFWNPLLAGHCPQRRWCPLKQGWLELIAATNNSTIDL